MHACVVLECCDFLRIEMPQDVGEFGVVGRAGAKRHPQIARWPEALREIAPSAAKTRKKVAPSEVFEDLVDIAASVKVDGQNKRRIGRKSFVSVAEQGRVLFECAAVCCDVMDFDAKGVAFGMAEDAGLDDGIDARVGGAAKIAVKISVAVGGFEEVAQFERIKIIATFPIRPPSVRDKATSQGRFCVHRQTDGPLHAQQVDVSVDIEGTMNLKIAHKFVHQKHESIEYYGRDTLWDCGSVSG